MTARPHAFTLLEILVVVTIIAIAASVSAALAWTTSSSVRLGAAVQNVVADLQYAQSQAITTQKKVYVVFTIANATRPDQYSLQSPLGTVIRRPAGAAGTVTMGRANTQLSGMKLGLTSALIIGFDTGGQPFSSSGTTDTPLMQVKDISCKTVTGGMETKVSIQPFTGEITLK